jgi:hypothetical protein
MVVLGENARNPDPIKTFYALWICFHIIFGILVFFVCDNSFIGNIVSTTIFDFSFFLFSTQMKGTFIAKRNTNTTQYPAVANLSTIFDFMSTQNEGLAMII